MCRSDHYLCVVVTMTCASSFVLVYYFVLVKSSVKLLDYFLQGPVNSQYNREWQKWLGHYIYTMSMSTPCLCLHHVYVYTTSMSTPCLCLHHVYIYTMSISTPCLCLHHVYVYTMSISTPCLCLHHVYVYTMSMSTPCLRLHHVYIYTMSMSTPCLLFKLFKF